MAESPEPPAAAASPVRTEAAAAAAAAAEVTLAAGPYVEIDQNDDDNDSAVGDEMAESTASLSSTIKNHVYENGRRYHAYQSGSYYAPNDEAENDRLDMHSHLATLILGGKLTTAPIGKNPQRILDVGCGTGIWTIDMGDEYPSAKVLGVDLSPTQPTMVPPNVSFEVDDVEAEWTHQIPFDFIHVRFLAGSIIDWPKLFKQCYAHTKPGGWIEFKDWNFHPISNDNSLSKDSYIVKYHQFLSDACNILNRNGYPGPHFKTWAEQAGFVNVTEQAIAVPLGMWAQSKVLKEIGAWNYICLEDGLEGVCMRLFTGILKWSVAEVHVFLTNVRAEMKSIKKDRVHAQYTYYVVTGQKPES